MPNPTDELTLDEIDDASPHAPRQLREYAERQKALADGAKSLAKENKALRAGIDVTTKMGRAWLQTTDADFDNAEALVADAKEFNPAIVGLDRFKAETAPAEGDTSQTQGNQVPDANATAPEPTGTAARRALADGAIPSATAALDPVTASHETAAKLLAAGSDRSEAIGEAIAIQARAIREGKLAPLGRDGLPVR